ncbi:DUF58 domain-containing protein [Xylanibacillus composti]|uniref:DUF58 domain-containing protein n=1 Tax=Xylanibacillus composti TaxID=1572762 RepID=A0A8J4H7Q0_9BACL|nr:DUF58 domain-containing protein [Xylanibacillus composti]MDT9725890.1 DUF58 domain-containing protein [Xylanibacillus composti]GIQ71281.1 hypothetical protein XYCOK13_41050 [Xylanibacillus composti]
MREQHKTGWGKLAILLFMVGFTGSVSLWQGGFAAWFLFIGSVMLLLPALIALLVPFRLEGMRQPGKKSAGMGSAVDEEQGRLVGSGSSYGGKQEEAVPRSGSRQSDRVRQDVAVHAGEAVQVHWRLRIDSMLPLPWLTLSETWRDGQGKVVHQAGKVVFPWFTRSISWSYSLPEWDRGVYASQGVEAMSGDLPGIVTRKRLVADALRVAVWPRIHAVSRGDLGNPAADAVRNMAAVPEEADLSAERRPYRPGDSLRRIDWRASARASSWLVREREWTRPMRLWLLVDTQQTAYEGARGQAQFEAAMGITASLLHTWDSRVLEAVLAVRNDDQPLFAAGGAARPVAMGQLAEALPTGRRPIHQRLTRLLEWIRPDDRVIVITARMDEDVRRSASMVKQATGQLQIWLPSSETMPAAASRVEEAAGSAAELDVVRCWTVQASRPVARAIPRRAADEAGGIARA